MNIDHISDMLTRIRNAQGRKKDSVEVFYSKLNEQVAQVLSDAGYIKEVKPFKHKDSIMKGLSIRLKYEDSGEPVIRKITRVSKPSLRKYIGYKDIKPVLNGLGIDIISTSRGIMSSDEAKNKKLGGEVICRIY